MTDKGQTRHLVRKGAHMDRTGTIKLEARQ
jgi:hypothetical protein